MSDSLEDDDEPEEPPLPETTNLTDPKSVRRARNKQKREANENEAFWRAVMNERAGRREMWRLIHTEGRAFNTEFSFGPVGVPDPLASWHNLGRQQFALRLYHDLLRVAPEATRKMHEEHDSRFVVMKPERRQPD